jgi:cold shock CspA family protein
MSDRRIGVVRKWVEDRGFGFLKVLEKRDDGKLARVDNSFPDVFLHYTRTQELRRSQSATFWNSTSRKATRA